MSAVVPSRAGAAWLPACLASLAAQGHPDLEVVVVDDGSPRGSVRAAAAAAAPRAVVVDLRPSGGFAAACNAGILASSGEWLLLLNDDAVLAPGALEALLDAARAAGADLAAPRILWAGRGGVLDNAGHALYPDGLNWCRGRGEAPSRALLQPGDLLLASGAAALVSRRAFAAVGLLDERFRAYGEDADLGLRAARAGLRAVYAPAAVVEHRISATYGRTSWRKVYRVERNRARIAAAHLPLPDLLLSPAFTALRHAALLAAYARGRGRPPRDDLPRGASAAAAVLAAHAASLIGLPGDLERRRRLSWLPMDRAYRERLRAHRISARALAGLAPAPWHDAGEPPAPAPRGAR